VLISNANELGRLLSTVDANDGDMAKVVNGLHLNLHGSTFSGEKEEENGVEAAKVVVEKGLNTLDTLKQDGRSVVNQR
jgi:hypothetical protein